VAIDFATAVSSCRGHADWSGIAMQSIVTILTFAAALGTGLIAGTFFAFSVFVMGALGKLPAAHGIAAMQSINVVVINPVFLGVFMGTAALSLVLGIAAVLGAAPAPGYLIAGALLYFAGCFLVTMLFNVPRNNALAAIAPDSPEGEVVWRRYLSEWTMWNTVRTIASLAATGFFILALR
jgi:uncharacterized membrane protein